MVKNGKQKEHSSQNLLAKGPKGCLRNKTQFSLTRPEPVEEW